MGGGGSGIVFVAVKGATEGFGGSPEAGALPFCFDNGVPTVFGTEGEGGIFGLLEAAVLLVDAMETGRPSARVVAGRVTPVLGTVGVFGTGPVRADAVDLTEDADAADCRR